MYIHKVRPIVFAVTIGMAIWETIFADKSKGCTSNIISPIAIVSKIKPSAAPFSADLFPRSHMLANPATMPIRTVETVQGIAVAPPKVYR